MSGAEADPSTVLLRAGSERGKIARELEPPAPAAHLVRIKPESDANGPLAPLMVELHDAQVTLGRGAGNSVKLEAYGVSRHHARLYPDAGGWAIEDAGSKNGVWVNDERIVSPNWLSAGDLVRIGRHVFRFELMHRRVEPVPDDVDLAETAPLDEPSAASSRPSQSGPELRAAIRSRAEPHAEELIELLLARARDGDVAAIRLVLEYLTNDS